MMMVVAVPEVVFGSCDHFKEVTVKASTTDKDEEDNGSDEDDNCSDEDDDGSDEDDAEDVIVNDIQPAVDDTDDRQMLLMVNNGNDDDY